MKPRWSWRAAASLSVLTACSLPLHLPRPALAEIDDGVTVIAELTHPTLKLPRICREGVALLSPFDTLPSGYREIARLVASGDWDLVSNSKLYRELRKEAAALGANAVIVESLRESTTAGRLVELATGLTQERRASARAIYVPADSQRVRVACASRR